MTTISALKSKVPEMAMNALLHKLAEKLHDEFVCVVSHPTKSVVITKCPSNFRQNIEDSFVAIGYTVHFDCIA